MDLTTLRKKLSTYESDKGHLRNLGDDVLYQLLIAWENWTGTGTEFYRAIGYSARQMASAVGKAKKLKREGHFGDGEFRQVRVEGVVSPAELPVDQNHPCQRVEITWSNGQVLRFYQVDLLLDFLRKAA
jgi:hypothetical protein